MKAQATEIEIRRLSIERCDNGYFVIYTNKVVDQVPEDVEIADLDDESFSYIREDRKVFITNDDLIDFITAYFKDQPRPDPPMK